MKILTLSALLCALMALIRADGSSYDTSIVKRSASCPCGWTQYYNRCFLYVAKTLTWPEAQKNCQTLNANLASVHSLEEYQLIQRVIFTDSHEFGLAWIGGSDAQQEQVWFWIDGSPFTYVNWAPGQPDNFNGNQNCLQMNLGEKKLWDDAGCAGSLPSVCGKRI